MRSTLKSTVGYFLWVINESRQQKTTTEIYDGLAKCDEYDALIAYPSRVASLKAVLKSVKTSLSSQSLTILDLACGTGAFIEAAREIFPKSTVMGIDLSKGMLQIAKQRFETDKKVTLKQGDIVNCDFPPRSFDLITFAHALRFIPQKSESDFVNNLARWLKPKGTVIIVNRTPIWKKLSFLFIGNRLTKRYNHNLVLEDYLIKSMKTHFASHGSIVLRKRLTFQTKAYFFTKSS